MVPQQDPFTALNNLNDTTLQGLNLNRFLDKQIMDPMVGSMTPFQGIAPYQKNNNSMVYNNPMNSYNQSPTSMEPGTTISNCIIRSSQGGQIIPGSPVLNGRVELNQGFTDSIGNQFAYDTLTAFDPVGVMAVSLYYGGILFNEHAGGVLPLIRYILSGVVYPQPISFGSGTVLADGTATINFPSTWTSVHNGPGSYTITPGSNFFNDSYQIIITPILNGPIMAIGANQLISSFDVQTYDVTGAPADSGFSFVLFTNTA